MLNNILKPFHYLRIHHGAKKKVDWYLPTFFTFVSLAFFIALDQTLKVDVFSASGLINRTLSFIQSLPGFYIAALAAIATFNKIDIDYIMPWPAPKMAIQIAGKTQDIELTRRRFLCLLFAFLTAESLLIIGISIISISAAEPLKTLIPPIYHQLVKYGFVGFFAFLVWQMIVATFWGLYYLGDRLHHPDMRPAPTNPEIQRS